MAAFDLPNDRDRIDYLLLRRSPIRVVHDESDLNTVVEWLQAHDYAVVDIDASWLTSRHMFADLASAFPGCCHDNFQCLKEGVDEGLAEALATSAGVALVLRGFDTFAGSCWEYAEGLLDLLADQAWGITVGGGRFVTLVQMEESFYRSLWKLPWTVSAWRYDRPKPS